VARRRTLSTHPAPLYNWNKPKRGGEPSPHPASFAPEPSIKPQLFLCGIKFFFFKVFLKIFRNRNQSKKFQNLRKIFFTTEKIPFRLETGDGYI
jgi:hypothetical protein